MNILLCGEGVTDVGERGEYDVKLGDYIWNEGSIPVIIRRILQEHAATENSTGNIHFICYTVADIAREFRPKHSAGQRKRFANGKKIENSAYKHHEGHTDVAAGLIRRAKSDGKAFDIVGMFKDTDRETGASNTPQKKKKKHDSTKQEILNGFEFEEVPLEKCFVAIPIRILENWLLSDSAAIAAVNQKGSTPYITDYPHPETLWGKEEPGTNHPKILLAKELKKCKCGNQSHVDKCLVIAENANLDRYKQKCPSFSEFYSDLLQAAQSYLSNS